VEYPSNTNFCTLCGSQLEQKQPNPKKKKKQGFLGELGNFIESTAESLDKATSTGKHNPKSSKTHELKIKKTQNICPNCKATLRQNIKFCNQCGTKLANPLKNPTPQKPVQEKLADDDLVLLEKLADMHNKGILNTAEFTEQKKRILNL